MRQLVQLPALLGSQHQTVLQLILRAARLRMAAVMPQGAPEVPAEHYLPQSAMLLLLAASAEQALELVAQAAEVVAVRQETYLAEITVDLTG